MAESEKHINLVRHLYKWVRDNILAGDPGSIYVDLPEVDRWSKPELLGSSVRPDLLVKKPNNNFVIIGEAKTAEDLETRHSIMQYNLYIDECEKNSGMIVMAVPWFAFRTAQNLLNALLKKKGANQTEIRVIDKLPG